MHSSGSIWARRASMVRPCSAVSARNPGTASSISSGSHDTSALGTSPANSCDPVVRQTGRDSALLGNRFTHHDVKGAQAIRGHHERWSRRPRRGRGLCPSRGDEARGSRAPRQRVEDAAAVRQQAIEVKGARDRLLAQASPRRRSRRRHGSCAARRSPAVTRAARCDRRRRD